MTRTDNAAMVDAMLSWLYRSQCAACGSRDAPFCEPCSGALEELGPACPRCSEPMPEDSITCKRCLREPLPLERIVAPWRFGGPLASAIRRLKFTGASEVARTLAPLWAPLLAAAASEAIPGAGRAIVVPIPLHWRRRLRRGYDHAWLLARHACVHAGLPRPVAALRRVRHAPPQSTLPASLRAANMRAMFAVRARVAPEIAGRDVILVDDVVTTGATLAAASRALLAAGASSVTGVAVARAGGQ